MLSQERLDEATATLDQGPVLPPPANSEDQMRQASPIFDAMKRRGDEVYAQKIKRGKRSIMGTIAGALDPEGKVGQQLYENRLAEAGMAQAASDSAQSQYLQAGQLATDEKRLASDESWREKELDWRKEEHKDELTFQEKELKQRADIARAQADLDYIKVELDRAIANADDKRARELAAEQIKAQERMQSLGFKHDSSMLGTRIAFDKEEGMLDREADAFRIQEGERIGRGEREDRQEFDAAEAAKDRRTQLLASGADPALLKHIDADSDYGGVVVPSPGGLGYGGRNPTSGEGRLKTVDDFIVAGQIIPEQAIAQASPKEQQIMRDANQVILDRQKVGYVAPGDEDPSGYKGKAPEGLPFPGIGFGANAGSLGSRVQ